MIELTVAGLVFLAVFILLIVFKTKVIRWLDEVVEFDYHSLHIIIPILVAMHPMATKGETILDTDSGVAVFVASMVLLGARIVYEKLTNCCRKKQ